MSLCVCFWSKVDKNETVNMSTNSPFFYINQAFISHQAQLVYEGI